MNIQAINTEQEYWHAMQRLEIIFDAELGSPEGDELEALGSMIDDFEKTHFPFDPQTN